MLIEERKEEILSIISSSPSRFRESYFIKHYPNLLDKIIDFCKNIIDLPFVQKVWHYVNDESDYIKCNCGNDLNFHRNWLDGYKGGCSAKCTQKNESTKEKRKNTIMNLYGVSNIAKANSVKERMEKTNLERYGTKSSFQNEEVRKKWKDNVKKKYGVEHTFQLESVREKSKKTNFERYGVEHFVQSEDYIDKLIKHNLETYGVEWFTQTEEYITKTKETNNLNWGTDWFFQSSIWKNNLNSDEFKSKIKQRYLDQSIKKYSDDTYELIDRNGSKLTFIDKRDNTQFAILYDCYLKRIQNGYEINLNKKPLNCPEVYNSEVTELHNFLDSNNIDYIKSDRTIISPKELDIVSNNVAIEYNGLWWHGEFKVDYGYHYNKTMNSLDKGYKLLHIWSDDFLYKKEIVYSMILSKLNKINNKIYARKCNIVKNISIKERSDFLSNNHIQGKASCSQSYSLFYNGEMVSLMTFGNRYINGKKTFELIRFCNKINTNVVGSASKLFNAFLKDNPEINEVITYCDLSHFDGGVYDKLGFIKEGKISSNYWWVVDGIRKNRYNFTKSKLVSKGYDKDKSESQIMHDLNAFRVWGSGTQRWIYNRK